MLTQALQEGSRAGGGHTRDDFRTSNLPVLRHGGLQGGLQTLRRFRARRQAGNSDFDGSSGCRGNTGSDPILACYTGGMAGRDGGSGWDGRRRPSATRCPSSAAYLATRKPVAANAFESASALLPARKFFRIDGFWPKIK